jgi:transposase-like protein
MKQLQRALSDQRPPHQQPVVRAFALPDRYADEAECEAALAAARWPKGFVCPNCSATAAWPFRRGAQAYRQCAACGYQCSLVVGTVFEGTKLPLSLWFLAMNLMVQSRRGLAAIELKRALGVSYPSARLMKRKLMAAALRRRDGHLEFDEVRLGVRRFEARDEREPESSFQMG